MDLLFISNVYASPTLPGKGAFNVRMVEALTKLGHRVGVVCPVAWTDELRAKLKPRPQTPSTIDEQSRLSRFPTYFFTPLMLRRAYAWYMWRSIRAAVDNLAAILRPQAVLGYWAHPDGRCAIEAARRLGVPSIVMTGGSDVLLLTKNRSRRRLVLDVMTDADAVVAVSDDLRSKLLQAGVPPEKVHVVRRGVDSTHFHPGDQHESRKLLGVPSTTSASMLLWVGRMTTVKGLSVLIEALDLLKHDGVNVDAYLIGDGELAPSLKTDVERRGLGHSVHFIGSIRDQGILGSWYRAADLTVLPSYSEGVPNVLLESIACGTPFVASSVGGVPEIASPQLDRLVTPGDPQELADAIRRQLQQSRAPNAQRTFTSSTCECAAIELQQVVERLQIDRTETGSTRLPASRHAFSQ